MSRFLGETLASLHIDFQDHSSGDDLEKQPAGFLASHNSLENTQVYRLNLVGQNITGVKIRDLEISTCTYTQRTPMN